MLVNNPKQPLHARSSFNNKIFWKRIIKKLLKSLFFLPNPVPFNGQSDQKEKGPETSDQLLFRLPIKFRKIPLLVLYYLTKFDDVIQRGFWVIPKIISANLCKPIHDIINYSTSICLFVSGKCRKEGKKSQNFKWSFLDEKKITTLFIVFEGLYMVKKIKFW